MKIIMYGTEICPDCVEAKARLKSIKDIELDYRNITANTSTLKEFLTYRDHEEMFDVVKCAGGIGIPLFILEDGTKTFDISENVEILINTDNVVSSCNIDGKGQC